MWKRISEYLIICFRKLTILKKNILIDCNMLKDLEREQEDYLSLALNNYIKCLIVSEKHHLHVYRVVALWLQNLTIPNLSNMVCTVCILTYECTLGLLLLAYIMW